MSTEATAAAPAAEESCCRAALARMLYQLRGHREFRVAYSITLEHSFHRPVCMWEVLLELTLTEKSDLWLLWLKSNFDRDSFPVGLSCLPKTLNPKPPKCNKMLHPKLKQEWHLTDCPVHPTAKTPEPKQEYYNSS